MSSKAPCCECFSRDISLHNKVAIPLTEGSGKMYPYCRDCGLIIIQYNFSKNFKRKYIKNYNLPIEIERILINFVDREPNYEITFNKLNTLIDSFIQHGTKPNTGTYRRTTPF